MAARVAGVPSPRSDMASRRASSSTSLPAPSIAERSVASVKRAGGLVAKPRASTCSTATCSPSLTATKVLSSARSEERRVGKECRYRGWTECDEEERRRRSHEKWERQREGGRQVERHDRCRE